MYSEGMRIRIISSVSDVNGPYVGRTGVLVEVADDETPYLIHLYNIGVDEECCVYFSESEFVAIPTL
jgi:hypothetical protein